MSAGSGLRAHGAQQRDRAVPSFGVHDFSHEFAQDDRVRLRKQLFAFASEAIDARGLAAGVPLGTDLGYDPVPVQGGDVHPDGVVGQAESFRERGDGVARAPQQAQQA